MLQNRANFGRTMQEKLKLTICGAQKKRNSISQEHSYPLLHFHEARCEHLRSSAERDSQRGYYNGLPARHFVGTTIKINK